jgi:signal transduction histidine kinase/phage shock protein PspC (stress-responsive transcriptional regulator)
VCGGISEATGIDVTLVRIGFILLTFGSGLGIPIYAVAWLFLPLKGESTAIYSRAIGDRRGIRLVIALIPLFVVVQILADALHVGYLGSISWPVFLAAAVAILIRRNASEGERVWIVEDLIPTLRPGNREHPRWTLVARIGTGLLLGLIGALILVSGHTSAAAVGPLIGVLLVIAALVVVFGPWWLSLVRDLMSERQARARAEERSEMAAHVHDSVLQTLALIQRSADDPQHVRRLARAQERELRSWLFEGRAPGAVGRGATTLSEGISLIQRQVEADHGINVQVVVVGNCSLDDGMHALLDASREATVNAAKWSNAPQVSIYGEVDGSTVMVYVRDRGCGFDPASVPDDRQGIASSICARMARFGGTATIRSAPGDGAEVELSMPRHELVQ